ncbi:MAG TPA: hypothetical protein VFC29_04765 [Candidatus Limnocylindrales bacterium]|nr:hypothetical protein [Candidatus Limnocylindrales bacterium]
MADSVNLGHGKTKTSDRARPSLLGICEYCNVQFSSGLMPIEAAKDDIQERFNVHKCKLTDGSQNALRIVREATENK